MAHHSSFTELSPVLGATLVLADTAGAAAWAREDFSVLTEQETNYANEFESDLRATWAAGRVVLRHVLGAHLGVDPAAIDIRLDSAGKPRIAEAEFSVSRARRLVLVAVGEEPLGIDIEAVPDHQVAAEAVRMLHAREQAELGALPEAELPAAFVRTWARKEAFLKALSTGLARDPSIDYVGFAEHPGTPHPDVEIADIVDGIPDGYAAAAAVNR